MLVLLAGKNGGVSASAYEENGKTNNVHEGFGVVMNIGGWHFLAVASECTFFLQRAAWDGEGQFQVLMREKAMATDGGCRVWKQQGPFRWWGHVIGQAYCVAGGRGCGEQAAKGGHRWQGGGKRGVWSGT